MALCLVFACGICLAAEFSADVVQKMGKLSMNGKVYVSGQKMRQETTGGPMSQISIMRGDKNVAYVLMPSSKQYMEMKGQKGQFDPGSPKLPEQLAKMATRKSLGKETVNGYVCDKSAYIFKDKTKGTMTQWISPKLHYPIKTDWKTSKGRIYMECKNIKEGRVAGKLFDVPKGYKKMTMPTRMPGMPGGPPKHK